MAWVRADMNRPGKTEHYLMSVAATVVRVNVKPGTRVDTEEFRLKFVDATAPKNVDPETAKAFTVAAFGAGAEHRTRTRAEAIAMGLLPPDEGAP